MIESGKQAVKSTPAERYGVSRVYIRYSMRQDVGGWGVKLEALRLLVALATSFRKLLQPHLAAVLAATWALFTAALPIYQQAAISGVEALDEEVRLRACK